MHENIYSSAIDGAGGVSQGRKKKSKEKHGRVLFLPTAAVECGSKQDYCDTE